jgi:hypothetical protein
MCDLWFISMSQQIPGWLARMNKKHISCWLKCEWIRNQTIMLLAWLVRMNQTSLHIILQWHGHKILWWQGQEILRSKTAATTAGIWCRRRWEWGWWTNCNKTKSTIKQVMLPAYSVLGHHGWSRVERWSVMMDTVVDVLCGAMCLRCYCSFFKEVHM